jgi:hypothetical protein
MLQQGLFNLLLNDRSVSAIVGDQVYLGTLRRGYTLPAVRINVITSTPIVTFDSSKSNLQYRRMQFDCFADQYVPAHQLLDAVKNAILDYRRILASGEQVVSTILEAELDNPLEEGKGGFAYRTMVDITIGVIA